MTRLEPIETVADAVRLLRQRAQELRDIANLTAGTDGARTRLKLAEELGRLANGIEERERFFRRLATEATRIPR